jgi:hypothetical protein
MNEVVEHSFRTKAGTCVITPERIVLERQGIRVTVGKWIYGDTIHRALFIYGMIGAVALAVGAWSLATESYFAGILLSFIGVFFIWNVFVSRNASAAPVIERSTIQSVTAHPPRPPFTRGYFVVRYFENGKERRRYIFLPGVMSNGKREYQRALVVMQEAGLLNAKQSKNQDLSG